MRDADWLSLAMTSTRRNCCVPRWHCPSHHHWQVSVGGDWQAMRAQWAEPSAAEAGLGVHVHGEHAGLDLMYENYHCGATVQWPAMLIRPLLSKPKPSSQVKKQQKYNHSHFKWMWLFCIFCHVYLRDEINVCITNFAAMNQSNKKY